LRREGVRKSGIFCRDDGIFGIKQSFSGVALAAKSTAKKRRLKKREPEAQASPAYPGEFFNRELSWLQFNSRVLAEAQDETNPLLERIKFLTIFTSNLDEFFMNRVGGLKQKVSASLVAMSPDGLPVQQQLAEIRAAVTKLVHQQSRCYTESLRPALEQNNIFLLAWDQLTDSERTQAKTYYQSNVFPILTPQAVDPGHPFPFISNLSISLGVTVRHPDRDEQLFARVKIPAMLPQVLRLETGEFAGSFRLVSLATVIEHNLGTLFPGMVVQTVMPFRITRNAEIDVDDYETEDLVELIEEELRERKFARVVRLEHGSNPDPVMLRFLMEEIELVEDDVYESLVDIDLLCLKEVSDLNIPKLKVDPWFGVTPPALSDEEANIFTTIRSGDVLVHHPYESFGASVERFLRTAVDDPRVVAIKMTLYRAGERSSLVPLLIRAAEKDKQVVCLIEVKAHFDEARNIRLAQTLEDAGVHVMYGVVGLKTHGKVILVVRQESEGIRCYAHLGSGNYNSSTARLYTDIGLFTCNPEICEDLVELFHFLTGRSLKRDYRKILVAPSIMKERLLKLVEREILNHQQGLPAGIIVKINSLEDTGMCRAITKAASVGVPIELIVRGICCLKPFEASQGPGPKVVSIVGRFLEHSRIFYFRNGAPDPVDGEMFISSADWMHRNLHRRVEIAAPLLDRGNREKCLEILQVMLKDQKQAWDLLPDGTYVRRVGPADSSVLSSQQQLMKLSKERVRTVLSGVTDSGNQEGVV
jgi:polyphosphate kinase